MDETTAKIKQFIVDEFMPDVPVEDLEDDFDLLTGGVVDSLGLLRSSPGSRTSSTSASTIPTRSRELPDRRGDQGVRRPGARHVECRVSLLRRRLPRS